MRASTTAKRSAATRASSLGSFTYSEIRRAICLSSSSPAGLLRNQQGQDCERAKAALERLFPERDPRVHGHVVYDHRLAFLDGAPDKAVFPGRALIEPERYHSDIVPARSVPGHGLHPIRLCVHEAEPCQPESPGADHDPAGFAKQLLALTHAHNGRVDSAQHGINTVEAGDVPLLLLAREELTDLAPDHVHGPQEPILRLPDLA